MRRAFVTGLGAVTPIGVGADRFWAALCQREAKFTSLNAVYPSLKPGLVAARLTDDQRAVVVEATRERTGSVLPDSSMFAVHAAVEAIGHAGLRPGDGALRHALVCVGNNDAEADLVDEMVDGDDGRWQANVYSSHAVAEHVAHAIGSDGPAFTIHNTCASGNVAMEFALRMIRTGAVDTAVVGGGDVFAKKVWTGFATLNALGPERCRPFSAARRYITIAEGAAFLVLRAERTESQDSVVAELVAAASSNDATHPTNPDAAGVSGCHRRVLDLAGIAPEEVDAVFAHGTGTKANDAVEAGIFMDRYPHAAITAIKGTVGHLMATAGSIGAVAACLALRDQVVPPTNIEGDELEYEIDLVTGPSARPVELRYVQNNSFGFGGNNAITVFKAAV